MKKKILQVLLVLVLAGVPILALSVGIQRKAVLNCNVYAQFKNLPSDGRHNWEINIGEDVNVLWAIGLGEFDMIWIFRQDVNHNIQIGWTFAQCIGPVRINKF